MHTPDLQFAGTSTVAPPYEEGWPVELFRVTPPPQSVTSLLPHSLLPHDSYVFRNRTRMRVANLLLLFIGTGHATPTEAEIAPLGWAGKVKVTYQPPHTHAHSPFPFIWAAHITSLHHHRTQPAHRAPRRARLSALTPATHADTTRPRLANLPPASSLWPHSWLALAPLLTSPGPTPN